jgi:hypothetical protein
MQGSSAARRGVRWATGTRHAQRWPRLQAAAPAADPAELPRPNNHCAAATRPPDTPPSKQQPMQTAGQGRKTRRARVAHLHVSVGARGGHHLLRCGGQVQGQDAALAGLVQRVGGLQCVARDVLRRGHCGEGRHRRRRQGRWGRYGRGTGKAPPPHAGPLKRRAQRDRTRRSMG